MDEHNFYRGYNTERQWAGTFSNRGVGCEKTENLAKVFIGYMWFGGTSSADLVGSGSSCWNVWDDCGLFYRPHLKNKTPTLQKLPKSLLETTKCSTTTPPGGHLPGGPWAMQDLNW